jgi:hypothetical protein
MPEAFEKCRRNGGRIRTVSGPNKNHGLGAGEYVHYCYLNGESFRGEVRKKENPGNPGNKSEEPRRYGNPRTDEERRERHKKLYGTSELPPRGTGLRK